MTTTDERPMRANGSQEKSGASIVGSPVSRVDGTAKVTGQALYSADVPVSPMAHGAFLFSTIASGRVLSFDTREALAVPGVLGIMTFQNVPPCEKANLSVNDAHIQIFPRGGAGETITPWLDDRVYYWGQHIGIAVADTLEHATLAASLTRVVYEETPPRIMDNLLADGEEPAPLPDFLQKILNSERGSVDTAWTQSPVQLEWQTTTPSIHQIPMENGATLAVWEGDALTLYDSSQSVLVFRNIVAQMLQMPLEKVRIITHFVGGGFGGKCMVWTHLPFAALAAKKYGVPVKVMLTRQEMFTSMGYRPQSFQTLRLGATQEGVLTVIDHDVVTQTSILDDYAPPVIEMTRVLYACPNVRTRQRLHKVNACTPTQMRAPGEALGLFALETAMDELAYRTGLDPIELRLRNYAEKEPAEGKPWSSKSLRECYTQAAARFGWEKRTPEPRSMRAGNMLLGMGMSSAMYPVYMSAAAARVQLFPDGHVVASSATQEMGNGAYTVMSQVAAEALGVALEQVTFRLGDTTLPFAPVGGASRSTASVAPAVRAAAQALRTDLTRRAITDPQSPLYGTREEEVVAQQGRLFVATEPDRGETYTTLFARQRLEMQEAYREVLPPGMTVEGRNHTAQGITANAGPITADYAMYSFGAQCVEVLVEPEMGWVFVTRVVGAYGAGRILSPKLAISQLQGGLLMGIGMALKEETRMDRRTGQIVTSNQLDYHVMGIAEAPAIDAFFVEEEDPHINALGVKGVGEIATTGTAAAVANAVYHATGKRILELPITAEKLQ